MQIAEMIFDFFGFGAISETATFVDLLQTMLEIGCGLWVTIFIIRSLFMATRISDTRFF